MDLQLLHDARHSGRDDLQPPARHRLVRPGPSCFPSLLPPSFLPDASTDSLRKRLGCAQWVAGSNCNAASCTNVQRYTPTSSSTAHDAVRPPPLLPLLSSLAAVLTLNRHAQNQPFTIDYVVGSVSGEIYWEEMEIGGRLVPYQSIGPSNPFYPYLFPFGS